MRLEPRCTSIRPIISVGRLPMGGLVSALFAVALSLGCAGAEEEFAFAFEQSNFSWGRIRGQELRSDHFRIRTTVKSEDFAVVLGRLLERWYRRYEAQIGPIIGHDQRLDVYVFATRAQWEAFTRVKMGPQARLYLRIRSGGYTTNDVSVLYYIGRYATLTVAVHESLHQYVARLYGEGTMPAWLNEGLASYYEAHVWDGSQPRFTPRRNLGRMSSLESAIVRQKLLGLEELLSTNAGQVVQKPRERVAAYYAQCWALISYLRHDEDHGYSRKLDQLLRECGTQAMLTKARGFAAAYPSKNGPISFGQAVFQQYLEADLPAFEAGFQRYMRRVSGLER